LTLVARFETLTAFGVVAAIVIDHIERLAAD
jgi:predicted outer membrane lipoprotein